MNKTFSTVSFAVLGLFMILLFVTAKSYTQLAIAIALYPVISYVAFKVFPREDRSATITVAAPITTPTPVNNINNVQLTGKVDVVDVDKRTFLKLIGATGLSFFLFSLLGRRAETLLFGESIESRIATIEKSITGESTITADAAINQNVSSTQGYRISEMSSDSTSTYYGFTNDAGMWFVMKEEVDSGSFRYVRGQSDFPKNWDKRENLSYDYYHNVFKNTK